MPYGFRKSGSKIQVINKETGRVLGTHPSKADAMKQMAALGAHGAMHEKRTSKKR